MVWLRLFAFLWVFSSSPVSWADLPDETFLVHKKIAEEGIPIEGVSGWPVKRIDFRREATVDQMERAWVIARTIDLEAERKKERDRKAAALQKINALGLTADDLREVLR